jgi:hypothetical protein
VTLLEDIRSFPTELRLTLVRHYGIETAEAFFVHALKDPKGVRSALNLTSRSLKTLVEIVEGYLSQDYVKRCREQPLKHPRGVILD